MTLKRITLTVFGILASILFVSAQKNVPFDTLNWDIRAQKYELKEYKGQQALFMQGGIALLRDTPFKNGIIEWDMAFPKERGFTGIRFRMQDQKNMEEFYFRPHQSGQPDANQYCPVDNGLSSWQLYHGAAYSVPYEYNFNKWFHVKLVLADRQAELYIDNMKTPVLHIPFLKREPKSGGLMVYGSLVPAYFANFSYHSMDKPQLKSTAVQEKTIDPQMVGSWSVSQAFPNTVLKGIHDLQEIGDKDWTWTELKAEASGIANLATISDFHPQDRNTVFARLVINAEKEEIKELTLGFSDRATVFCNGRAIFSGNETYRSRDFRYLGTIGLFDTVHLPLKKGRNEIWVAVTEAFGGWGIIGKWE